MDYEDEDLGGNSPEHEGSEKAIEMARQQLSNIQSNVAALLEKCACHSKQMAEPWVQSKLTLADDYLDTVHDYVVNGGEEAGQMEDGNVGFVVAVEKAMTKDGSRNS